MNDSFDNQFNLDFTNPDTARPHTLAEALQVVETWNDLAAHRRRDLRDALLAVARMAKLPPEAIALECASLSHTVLGHPPRFYGMENKRHANVVSGLRFVLRRLGISDDAPHRISDLSPEWRRLWDGITAGSIRYPLSRFFGFCSRRDVRPGLVDMTTVEHFVDNLLSRAIVARPSHRGRRVATAWNALATTSHGALQTIDWRRGRKRIMLPLDAFPTSFQADVETFRRRISLPDPVQLFQDFVHSDQAPLTPHMGCARPSTVALRTDQIRLAGSALVHSGRSIHAITSLACLVADDQTIRDILNYFWERGGGKRSTYIGGITEVLRQIAQHHSARGHKAVERLADLRGRVSPNDQGICPRNRERLRQLCETRTRAMLVHLPDELERRAQLQSNPAEARRLMMCAVALQILLVCPLRISNLIGLRLDRHLRREMTGKKRVTHIVLAAEEVKNATSIEWPLSRETADMIDRWVRSYRPTVSNAGGTWLFPRRDGQSISKSGLRTSLTNVIERIIGVRVNPHLLRHFAAWLYLKHNPGNYEAVRRILGHKSLSTTLASYTGLEADAAAKRLDDIVLHERRDSQLTATRGFQGRRQPGSRAKGGR